LRIKTDVACVVFVFVAGQVQLDTFAFSTFFGRVDRNDVDEVAVFGLGQPDAIVADDLVNERGCTWAVAIVKTFDRGGECDLAIARGVDEIGQLFGCDRNRDGVATSACCARLVDVAGELSNYFECGLDAKYFDLV
jgi:hypothetical protein